MISNPGSFSFVKLLMTTCEPFHLSNVVHSECVTENELVAIRSQAHTAGPKILQNSFMKWLLKNSGNYMSETVLLCDQLFLPQNLKSCGSQKERNVFQFAVVLLLSFNIHHQTICA